MTSNLNYFIKKRFNFTKLLWLIEGGHHFKNFKISLPENDWAFRYTPFKSGITCMLVLSLLLSITLSQVLMVIRMRVHHIFTLNCFILLCDWTPQMFPLPSNQGINLVLAKHTKGRRAKLHWLKLILLHPTILSTWNFSWTLRESQNEKKFWVWGSLHVQFIFTFNIFHPASIFLEPTVY